MANDGGYAVLFDMDGVLVDSHEMIWDSVNLLLRKHRVHLSEQEIRLYTGRSLRDNFASWSSIYNLRLDFEKFKTNLWAQQSLFLQGMKADKDLVNLLTQLGESNVKKGVATSSMGFRATAILDALELTRYFPVIVTADQVERHKPYPDIFLAVARRLQETPKRCIVIEDSANGIAAARKAGMKVIGYLNGRNDMQDLKDADEVIKSFAELNPDRLRKNFY